MKRLALVLTVAALAAVGCTTPGSVPVTTSSSSTTQAGASAREAFVPLDFFGEGPDASQYPSGATVQSGAYTDAGACSFLVSNFKLVLGDGRYVVDPGYAEIPGSRVCGDGTTSGTYSLTNPAPLPAGATPLGVVVEYPDGSISWFGVDKVRIRW